LVLAGKESVAEAVGGLSVGFGAGLGLLRTVISVTLVPTLERPAIQVTRSSVAD
jgi:hypothetical protein